MVTPPARDEQPSAAEPIDLDRILDRVLDERRDDVAAWLRDEPGSWGRLAGQGVLAARTALGRRLTEGERRAVWQRLWGRLTEVKRDAEDGEAPRA